MDQLNVWTRLKDVLGKYKYVILIVALGIFLMLIPTEKKTEDMIATPIIPETQESIEENLEKILGQIRGVGKVQVMLTEQTGSETLYQSDEERTDGEGSGRVRRETVIVSGGGVQSGLVRTVTPPTYLGAIVVCQGAGSSSVRLAVSNAVAAVTGLGMDRISVLEMK